MSRGIFAYLTRSGNPKKKDDQQKKKKRRWLFRRAESVSSLTDQYSNYPGFGNAAPSFGASPYGDLSPNSFFTETGKLQKDKEMMKKAQNRGGGSRTVEPEVDLTLDDLDLPQSSVLRRPSLYEVFENKGDRKGEPTQTLGPSLVVDDNKGEDKEDDDDDDDDDEIASPYEQDSFHQRMDSKASSSSGNKGVRKVSPQATDTEQYSRRQDRKNVRSITEESIAVYSEAQADSRVKKHGREKLTKRQHPPYYPFPPIPPPHLYNQSGKNQDNPYLPPFLPPLPPGYRFPPPPHPHMMLYHPHPHHPPPHPHFPFPPGYPPFFPPLPEEEQREVMEGDKRQQRRRQHKQKRLNKPKPVEPTEEPKEDDPFKDLDVPPGLNNFLY